MGGRDEDECGGDGRDLQLQDELVAVVHADGQPSVGTVAASSVAAWSWRAAAVLVVVLSSVEAYTGTGWTALPPMPQSRLDHGVRAERALM